MLPVSQDNRTSLEIERDRKPDLNSFWSMTRETRFGPDYISLEEVAFGCPKRTGIYLLINETTDPIDGYQCASVLLHTESELQSFIDGLQLALDIIRKHVEGETGS